MGKKNGGGNLGRAMIKSRLTRKHGQHTSWIHTSELNDGSDWNRINLNSVTEQNSLDEFLTTAELAGTDFEAERLNVNFVSRANVGVLTKEEKQIIKEAQDKHRTLLRIPRRPLWKENSDLDTDEFQIKEREAFLEWRRKLADLQNTDNITLTPFEKNLEFWRQLWRVIERSDVIVQIVDARNPLLFRCEDLESYVKEIDSKKMNIILINKSDFLTLKQRVAWLRYFDSQKIQVVFWSAVLAANEGKEPSDAHEHDDKKSLSDIHEEQSHNENEIEGEDDIEEEDEDVEGENELETTTESNKFQLLDEDKEESFVIVEKDDTKDENKNEESKSEDEEDDGEESEETDGEDEAELQKDQQSEEKKVIEKIADMKVSENEDEESGEFSAEEIEKCKILTREELIDLFKKVHEGIEKYKEGVTTIGMVGYPNVGKSSTINALMQSKKVAVSDTPGKTKHYQTLFVDEALVLCDCPGLVFPSFVSTKGDLILNGVLPIDHMRDHNEPISLVVHQIPRRFLEVTYGILIPKPKEDEDPERVPTVEEFCAAFAVSHGYMNHKGMPDVQRSARVILKDYVNGKFVFSHAPPGIDEKSFQQLKLDPLKAARYDERVRKIELHKSEFSKLSAFDQNFFRNLEPRAMTKGGIVGYGRNKVNQVASAAGSMSASTDSLSGKPWKKHFNSKNKGKLRRFTAHLDA